MAFILSWKCLSLGHWAVAHCLRRTMSIWCGAGACALHSTFRIKSHGTGIMRAPEISTSHRSEITCVKTIANIIIFGYFVVVVFLYNLIAMTWRAACTSSIGALRVTLQRHTNKRMICTTHLLRCDCSQLLPHTDDCHRPTADCVNRCVRFLHGRMS